jgi:GNAT superfamily N-acetyltransferase
VSSPTVRPLAPDETEAACQVIGLAFADNPSSLAVVRGDRSRAIRTMERSVRAVKLGGGFSHVLVAERHGRLLGVLNATPWPHCQLSLREQLRSAPALVRVMGSALPRAMTMTRARARHDRRQAHWHLGPIGVHPDHQGEGVGSAPLGAFLERVDQVGSPAFLETDVDFNVVLYERFGFRVVGRQDILAIDTRFMWRTPPVRDHG